MKFELRDEINCPAARFWSSYFDPKITRRLYLEALGSTSFEMLLYQGNLKKGIQRTVRYTQRPEGFGPVMKLFGTEVAATETGTFDPRTALWSFTVMPGILADNTDIRGSIRLEDHDETCEQVFTLEAKVRILGMGPIVERLIERQARDIQNRAVRFVNGELATTA